MPPNQAAQDGTTDHDLASGVLLGEIGIDSVPLTRVNHKGATIQLRAGIELYANHVWENRSVPAVERYWESIEIDDFGGTIDCFLHEDRTAVVYDYKSGTWPVYARNNPQLLCYCAIADEHFHIDTFYGVIVQPNAFKGDKVKVAEYSRQQVDNHRLRVIGAASSDHKQTGEHCRFCPLRLLKECPEGVKYGKQQKGWN